MSGFILQETCSDGGWQRHHGDPEVAKTPPKTLIDAFEYRDKYNRYYRSVGAMQSVRVVSPDGRVLDYIE